MKDIDYINTFFNMIYHNEQAYMRDIVSSFDYIQGYCEWLLSRNIECDVFRSIMETDTHLFQARMKASDVNHLLHIPFTEEVKRISDAFINKTHIVLIPGFNEESVFQIDKLESHGYCVYNIRDYFQLSDLSFYDPFDAFFHAMNHADAWHGALVFNEQERIFIPIHSDGDLRALRQYIEWGYDLFQIYDVYEDDSYFVHISDTHFGGKNKTEQGLERLYSSLDHIVPLLKSNHPLKFLITGDLMELPNRKNMYTAHDFMIKLKKNYKADVTFILGNHDVIVHGFNFGRMQKSKVIAYLLGENIKVIEDEKIILIKMDTTSEGNLARGKVGQRQLDEIDEELSVIDHIEDYTLIVMLHHHVYPITKAQFIKTKWHEKTFINNIVETSKVLVDAPLLIQWLKKYHIQYVVHGHKHLPFFRKEDGIYYIGAGSATGGLKESKSRYISYNLLKYNLRQKKMTTCMIFYDDKAKAERQRVEVYLFRSDDNESGNK